MLVALMMEGKFSGEGLQTLDTDEDLMSAMARELVEKAGVGESADAVWRELDQEREKMQPRPITVERDLDQEPAPIPDAPSLDLPVMPTPQPVPMTFGIRLAEPYPPAKRRKKATVWPTATETDVQFSLFD
jgi:hypothetical protein